MRLILIVLLSSISAIACAQATPLQLHAWQGDSVAMLKLSEAYTFGTAGVSSNLDSANFYIDKSAQKGYRDAQYLRGIRLLSNVHDPKKYADGMLWVKKAADQGQKDAYVKLSQVHRTKGSLTEADKFYNLAKSYEYAEKAAVLGDVDCLRYCAESRLTGTGTTKNDSIAIAFMQRAATEKRHVPAMVRMGDFYLEGKMTGKPEPFIAYDWYIRAYNSPNINVDQRNSADFGIFKVDKYIRQIHNAMMAAGGMLPAGTYEYIIRKE